MNYSPWSIRSILIGVTNSSRPRTEGREKGRIQANSDDSEIGALSSIKSLLMLSSLTRHTKRL